MPKRVFITVAEVSGDLHAAQLIRSLRRLRPDLIVEGHGGPAMAAAGAILHRETVGAAAMAWRGALRALEVLRLLRWTRRYFEVHRPDLQICIDSSAMNLHFAKLARRMNIPILYYIAPQLWASREGRMKHLRLYVDRLACILPFEEAYFRSHGVNASFVGHPLFDELPPDRALRPFPTELSHNPTIGLLPGSRRSEAQVNFPHLLDVAERVLKALPGASFLVPTTAATQPVVARLTDAWRTRSANRRIDYRAGAFDAFVSRCDLCITVSGTATLHVASHGVPMIVVYRVNPLIWHAAGRWVVKTRTYALVNLLAASRVSDRSAAANAHIVPEFIPWFGPNQPVADLAVELLRDPSRRAQQQEKLRTLVASLDRPGASDNVARLAVEMIEREAAI